MLRITHLACCWLVITLLMACGAAISASRAQTIPAQTTPHGSAQSPQSQPSAPNTQAPHEQEKQPTAPSSDDEDDEPQQKPQATTPPAQLATPEQPAQLPRLPVSETAPGWAGKIYSELQNNGLDPARVYRIRDAAIDREDLHVNFEDGLIAFTKAVDGRITGALF